MQSCSHACQTQVLDLSPASSRKLGLQVECALEPRLSGMVADIPSSQVLTTVSSCLLTFPTPGWTEVAGIPALHSGPLEWVLWLRPCFSQHLLWYPHDWLTRATLVSLPRVLFEPPVLAISLWTAPPPAAGALNAVLEACPGPWTMQGHWSPPLGGSAPLFLDLLENSVSSLQTSFYVHCCYSCFCARDDCMIHLICVTQSFVCNSTTPRFFDWAVFFFGVHSLT